MSAKPKYPTNNLGFAWYALGVKRAVIYARVSLDQTGERRSVDRQLDACRALCEARGWTVVEERTDNSISAWSGKARPAWQETLGLVASGAVDVIVAWHIDRMTRSMRDLEDLVELAEKQGVGVATASGDIDLTTDVGRMVARILAAVARAEVERKAARQRLANAQRAAEGSPMTSGPRPFGYADDRVHVDPREAEAIRQAARDVLAGESLAGIARRWKAAGLVASKPGADGHGWTATGVRNLLINPRYIGVAKHKGQQTAQGQWEAVLDADTHLALVALLTDPTRDNKNGGSRGRTPTTLLTGIARCSVCDGFVTGDRGSKGPVYTCRNGSHVMTPRDRADAWVSGYVVDRLSRPDVLKLLVPSGSAKLDKARSDAVDLRRRLDEVAAAYASDAITLSQLTSMTVKLRGRLEAAESVLAQSDTGALVSGLGIGTEAVKGQWEPLPLARKRKLVAVLADVKLYPNGKGGWRTLPVEKEVRVNAKKPPSTSR